MEMIDLQQYGQIYPADIHTPIGLYMKLVGKAPGILLESAEVDGRLGRYSLLAWDFLLVLSSARGKLKLWNKDSRFDELQELEGQEFIPGLREVLNRLQILPPEDLPQLPALTRSLCGYFGYSIGGMLEPKLQSVLPCSEAESSLVLPGKLILFDHLDNRCFFLSLRKEARPKSQPIQPDMEGSIQVGQIQSEPGKDEYCAGVSKVREMINSGEAIQVVLSTRFSAPFSGEPFVLYRRLRQANPSPYMYFLRLPQITIIGASPEVMVRCSRGELEERPIAGTRRRSKSDSEDQELEEELLADPKERAEHVMLVDLGRNDLGRVAKPGSVQMEKFMQVERFSHVMHLTSYLKAELQDGLDHIDVLRAAFPAGTVSGAPKIRAMEIIAETEKENRGPYSGAVGWLGLDKDSVNLDTGILIRSMWVHKGMLSWQAGAGIVSDSVPEKEWQECQNKAKIIEQILKQQGGSDVFTHR